MKRSRTNATIYRHSNHHHCHHRSQFSSLQWLLTVSLFLIWNNNFLLHDATNSKSLHQRPFFTYHVSAFLLSSSVNTHPTTTTTTLCYSPTNHQLFTKVLSRHPSRRNGDVFTLLVHKNNNDIHNSHQQNHHHQSDQSFMRGKVSPLASYTTSQAEETAIESTTTTTTTTTENGYSGPNIFDNDGYTTINDPIICQTDESTNDLQEEQQYYDDNDGEYNEDGEQDNTPRGRHQKSSKHDEQQQQQDMMEQRRKDAIKAIRLKKQSKTKSTNKAQKNTSVGARRIGSASRARNSRSGTSIGRMLGGFQSAAAAAATSSSSKKLHTNIKPKKESNDGDTTDKSKKNQPPSNISKFKSSVLSLDPKSIRSAISEIVTQQREKHNLSKLRTSTNEITLPEYMKSNLSVRLATPKDDANIANLRLSVFSDFTPDQRRLFSEKSQAVLSYRRLKGATCVVAFLPHLQRSGKEYDYDDLDLILPEANHLKNIDRSNTMAKYDGSIHPAMQYPSFLENLNLDDENMHGGILGSAECSTHEFSGTELGRQRPSGSVMYITEFAVSPVARRAGIGTKLLQGIEVLARRRCVETLYLHVDVTNDAAIEMYTKQGFRELDSRHNPLYAEFTIRLNLHDGAKTARNNKHHLLCKNLVERPTWVNGRGTLGFDIPQ